MSNVSPLLAKILLTAYRMWCKLTMFFSSSLGGVTNQKIRHISFNSFVEFFTFPDFYKFLSQCAVMVLLTERDELFLLEFKMFSAKEYMHIRINNIKLNIPIFGFVNVKIF